MFPFSVTHRGTLRDSGQRAMNAGCELIAFDAEKLNVFAAEVRYCEPHWHSAPELVVVLRGGFSVAVGQQSRELEQHDTLYINAEEVHSLRATAAGSRLVTVQFSPGLFDTLHPAPVLDWRPQPQAQDAVRQALAALIARIVDGRAPFQRIAVIYQLLDALVSAGEPVARAESTLREEAMIKRGIEYINQHFDKQLTLDDVARHSGMSYSWFSRMFKKVSRYNFKEYLTLVRLNKARTLLRDTQTPITTISHSCGFQEHKYLIAAFKKYGGLTPTEYRKRYLSSQSGAESMLTPGEDVVCLPLNLALADLPGEAI